MHTHATFSEKGTRGCEIVLSVGFWQKPVPWRTGFAAIPDELLRVETKEIEEVICLSTKVGVWKFSRLLILGKTVVLFYTSLTISLDSAYI
jgi:hypothetical protein